MAVFDSTSTLMVAFLTILKILTPSEEKLGVFIMYIVPDGPAMDHHHGLCHRWMEG